MYLLCRDSRAKALARGQIWRLITPVMCDGSVSGHAAPVSLLDGLNMLNMWALSETGIGISLKLGLP